MRDTGTKVPIDIEQLRDFAELARRNGTEYAFIDMAMEWATAANNECARLTKLLKENGIDPKSGKES